MLRGWVGVSPRRDVLAALAVWAVLVPESLAYATIAGVPPVVGLSAAVPSLLVYALLGSSRHLVVAPMSATAALSAGTVAVFTGGDPARFAALTAALALMVGVVSVVAGLLRLGFLSSFISEPVLKGFIVGLALTIAVGQVPALTGVDKGHGAFFEQALTVLGGLGAAHGPTLLLGVGSLGALLALRRWLPLVPGALVVVAAGIAVTTVFDLDAHGVEIVGEIDSGLPPLGLPDVTVADCLALAGPAVGVALVGYVEGVAAAKTYADRGRYRVESDTEFLAVGAANLAAGLASGMVVNGSLSKTAVNGGAGARSQLSGLVVGGLTLVTLALLTGLFERLPEATLAAVVIAAVVDLVDIGALRRYRSVWTTRLGRIHRKAARADFLAATAALAGVLVLDTLPGLAIGVGVSFVLLLRRSSRPNVTPLVRGDRGVWVDAVEHDGERPHGVVVLRVESGLYFANAEHVGDRILEEASAGTRAVVLAAASVASLDVTAAVMLDTIAARLRDQGTRLVMAQPIGQVRDVLNHVGTELIPVYRSIDDAVAAVREGDG